MAKNILITPNRTGTESPEILLVNNGTVDSIFTIGENLPLLIGEDGAPAASFSSNGFLTPNGFKITGSLKVRNGSGTSVTVLDNTGTWTGSFTGIKGNQGPQ